MKPTMPFSPSRRDVSDDERRRASPEHRFKSRAEMAKLFKDLPEAIQNTIEIAMRCQYRPRTLKTPILPRFTADEDEAEVMRRLSHDGLKERLLVQPPAPGFSGRTTEIGWISSLASSSA
jgi:DNA polymerase III subunit alpha